MQRHAEGHGHLWQKQAIVLNEQQEGLKNVIINGSTNEPATFDLPIT